MEWGSKPARSKSISLGRFRVWMFAVATAVHSPASRAISTMTCRTSSSVRSATLPPCPRAVVLTPIAATWARNVVVRC
ncbi:hypothetical protein NFA_50030 [Nocardia farcinica IFM 10152]|uniref:Uncharacterized protein n=1 Tax=Nocardia farcinica (strain IFM 10152) TaxID=247156 RepID=Q5YPN6_NOCFA|nr:hypothetical protein NFA_50030 [Nocardia farcinica IFM 10152]